MFLETQDGDIINGDTIARIYIYHQSEGTDSYAVEANLTNRNSKTLFTGRHPACKQKLQAYTQTLNNRDILRTLRQVHQELSGIRHRSR